MDSLETQLMDAVRSGKIDVVQTLLDKGANVNYIPSKGKSALSTAAALGNVTMIQLLLNAGITEKPSNKDECPRKKLEQRSLSSFDDDKENRNEIVNVAKQTSDQQNLGYYIFVHGDEHEHGCRGVCDDINRNENLDAETPEGMEGLEWDVELEVGEEIESDDIWSNQYRWYADILDKTGGIIEDKHRECDLNLQDYTGRCAVHYAVEYRQVDALRYLISSGCKPDVGDVDNLTPLHLAAMRDYREIAELLISKGANVNRKTTDKMAPLHYAAVRGFAEMVALLVEGGAAVDALDANDRTPLMLSVTRDHYDVVELLISYGAKVNIEEIHGYTPLCEAVSNKSVEMAALLLKSGAKLTQSQHLLHYAVLHRHTAMAELLLRHGAYVNLRDDHGDTPLVLAVLHRHTAMAELLLRHGAYVNLRDDHGDTPLVLAVSCGHLDTIRLLLQYEANPRYANSLTNVTPLHKAQEVAHVSALYDEILKLLCLYNVDLDMPGGGTFTTPLTYALLSEELNVAASLIRAGADVNKYCDTRCLWRNFLQSNLDLALAQKADDIVYLLVAAGFDLSKYAVEYPKDFSTVEMDNIRGWLTVVKFNPRRLDDLCRLSIRSQMGNKALHTIPLLEIPQIVKKFLLFEDVYVARRVPPDKKLLDHF